ncbi:hypothetical protein [Streptomyces sp. NRRL B-1140]|uniref:hypothetical protein n=1 Tax=Streptomyces sp. NRRL B-1140 TaxID=1415549 RepID=UPI00131BE4F3|nr:hypothetical protein [Streptomyces sp. NRRL B-1140]
MLSFTHTVDGATYSIRFTSADMPFSMVHQALSDTPLRQDLEAARRIYRFITRNDPKPTLGDLWSALVSEGLTERVPLGPDLTDPALVTLAVFRHLEERVHDDVVLLNEVQEMQGAVVSALRHDLIAATSSRAKPQLGGQPLGREEIEDVAPAAEETIDHTLARLFLRLGPPPESTTLDYTPAGRGGGGAQQ